MKMLYKSMLWVFLANLAVLSFAAFAKDLGNIGKTYAISETDVLAVMQKNLEKQIGDIANWQKSQWEEVQHYADRPLPVQGLTRTLKTRSWIHDPSVTTEEAIMDESGKMIFDKGIRINPLDTVSFSEVMLFYDGDDPDQTRWAKTELERLQGNVMPILTNGSVSTEANRLNQQVYFDQGGRLVDKFGIQHLPAKVEQENQWFRVTEVKP